MGLRIVIDDAVAWQNEAFGHLGKIIARPGRAIDRSVTAQADALIVRTVTRVDRALVQGTPIRFVGSATAGEDHIDRAALESLGITVATAPGCNAQAVAEYVVSALAHIHPPQRGEPPGPVGVIGFGHVGRRTTRALRALGYHVNACDPPLERQRAEHGRIEESDPSLVNMARFERLQSLEQLIDTASILTVHVPLVRGGANPTMHLFDVPRFTQLRRGQLLLNTSRGGVIDDAALARWLADEGGTAVLDVWEHEPQPLPELLRSAAVSVATPHIAGYSLEGKVAATRAIHIALCRFLGRPADFHERSILGPPGLIPLRCDAPDASYDWRPWIQAAIPLRAEDQALRHSLQRPPAARGLAFETQRRGYVFRRELSAFRIEHDSLDAATYARLGALGLQVPSPTTP